MSSTKMRIKIKRKRQIHAKLELGCKKTRTGSQKFKQRVLRQRKKLEAEKRVAEQRKNQEKEAQGRENYADKSKKTQGRRKQKGKEERS